MAKENKKAARLRAKGDEDLAAEALELRQAIWRLRLQVALGQISEPQKVRRTRRELARVLTLQRERRAAGATAQSRTPAESKA